MATHGGTDLIECNAANVRRFLEHTHSGRFDVIDELVDENIVTHGFPGGSNPASREEYKAFFEWLDALWADMVFDLHALVADKDHVAARFTVTATHASDAMGIPATGRRVAFDGMALYRVRDGRIAETWLHPDNLAILEQLGAAEAVA